MWNMPSLLLLPGPLGSEVVVPVDECGKKNFLIIYYTSNYLSVYKQMIHSELNY